MESSGLFYVPTGGVLDYGEFSSTYTNLVDVDFYRKRHVKNGASSFEGNAFSFSLSPFPGFELGMSNMGYDRNYGQDLIANIKYSPTLYPTIGLILLLGQLISEVRQVSSVLFTSFLNNFLKLE